MDLRNTKIKFNQETKSEKGITLIALVVTIIVLLILAGVSIAMLTGENGLLRKAADAKVKQDKAAKKEQGQIEDLARYIDKTLEGGLSTEEVSKATENGMEKVAESNLTNQNLKSANVKGVIKETEKEDAREVPIPLGATYVEGKESTGVVIEYKGSEFVWVPVKDAIYDSEKDDELPKTADTGSLTTGHTYTPMAINVGTASNPEYKGLLYTSFDTTKGSYLMYNNATNNPNYQGKSNQYREPALLDRYDIDDLATLRTNVNNNNLTQTYLSTIGLTRGKFGDEMIENYNGMVESVAKYGGFYVGRYETSIDGGTVASKKSPVASGTGVIRPMSANVNSGNRWYGMYDKQKKFTGNSDSVQSSMIWGSQYDAMINWMLTGTDKEKVGQKTNGNHTGSLVGCGQSSNDRINNIYDLEGNIWERTPEANDTGGRSYRRRHLLQ